METWRPFADRSKTLFSPMELPTQTAVATAVLDSIIHVCHASCVPVLPIRAVPSYGLAPAPVPPFITPCSAYAAVAATSGESTWVHVRCGLGSSSPAELVTRSMAWGWQ